MKKSPYNGKHVDLNEIRHLNHVLKFYYDDLETLNIDAVADIMRMEFGCKVNKNDVYLYLVTAQYWDDDGNLLCHYQHHVHNNPFFYPGLQDITTSVNFTAVAQHAEEIGLDVKGYTNQAYFLLGCGIDDLVADDNFSDIQSQIKISQQLKKLIMPEEMGERFKVIALTKKYDKELLCFSKMNQIDRL